MDQYDNIRKANEQLEGIGMGSYQWTLFFIIGYGYFCDNLWPTITQASYSPISVEFRDFNVVYMNLVSNLGVLVGSLIWGVLVDLMGRKWSCQLTLALIGFSGLIQALVNNFYTINVFNFLVNAGTGGNTIADITLFTEFVPRSHSWTLAILAIWWPLGNLCGMATAYGFIGNFSCPVDAETCARSQNMGWRYLMLTYAIITIFMFFIRFFVFTLHETPRFLVMNKKYDEANEVISRLAIYNGKTVDSKIDFQKHDTYDTHDTDDTLDDDRIDFNVSKYSKSNTYSKSQAVKKILQKYFTDIKMILKVKRLRISLFLVFLLYLSMGIGSGLWIAFLPYFLSLKKFNGSVLSRKQTYFNTMIIAIFGIPGVIFSSYAMGLKYVGRRGTVAISGAICGIAIYCMIYSDTLFRYVAFNCMSNFGRCALFGSIYAFTSELFPTQCRAGLQGFVQLGNRFGAVLAPIIILASDTTMTKPLYISGALYFLLAIVAVLVPIETRTDEVL